MLRVPGSRTDLFRLKSKGADVRIVYSPLDCLKIAQSNSERQVVFFAIGFETTAPANAMTVLQAHQLGIGNFSLLVSHVRVPPAVTSILRSPHNRVQGFLGPGHVCTIMGSQEYRAISAAYKVPIVITGFEPLDILEGVFRVVRQLEAGRAEVENQYSRVVTHSGNLAAHDIIQRVFEVCDQKWRGVGTIPQSGYKLRPEFAEYDAAQAFAVEEIDTAEPAICISGQILTGLKKPHECPAFAQQCTPQHPLGATMVSAEGACAAYFNYGRHLGVEPARSQPPSLSP
jgi:hydrogenase expression/formation protein HypD